MYIWSCHHTACSGRSLGWTGTRRYADSISTLAISTPVPNVMTMSATLSTRPPQRTGYTAGVRTLTYDAL